MSGALALVLGIAGGSAVVATTQPNSKASFNQASLDALAAMKALNLIVIDDWYAGNEVEGKVWVGDDVFAGKTAQGQSVSKTQIGFGNVNAYAGQSSYATLTVGGNLNIGVDLSNGATKNGYVSAYNGSISGSYGANIVGNATDSSNGLNLSSAGAKVRVGGYVSKLELNSDGADVVVDGQIKRGDFNGKNMSVEAYSFATDGGANANGLGTGSTVSISTKYYGGGTPATGWSFRQNQTLEAPAAVNANAMQSNMVALSSTLSNLATNTSSPVTPVDRSTYDLLFKVNTAASGDYTVFSVTASQLFGARNVGFQLNGSSKQIVINVTDFTGANGCGSDPCSYTFSSNGINNATTTWSDSLNSQVLWNFTDAADCTVTFNTDLHGAVLDPLGTIKTVGVIDGTVVAADFYNSGEVHLGTYDGQTPGVPEPATWAMMVIGFGAIGGTIRRRQRTQVAFA